MEGEEKAGSGAEVDGVQRGRTRDLGSHPAGVPSALERPRVYVNSQGKTIIYLSEASGELYVVRLFYDCIE